MQKPLTAQAIKKAINTANQSRGLDLAFYLRKIEINGEFRGASGFIHSKGTGKSVYVNSETLTFYGEEYHVLYRTADHLKDYSGGHNCYATPEQLGEAVLNLLVSQ